MVAGESFYGVWRRSWETGEPVCIREFLTHVEADLWIEDIEERHNALVLEVDGFPALTRPVNL